MHTDRQKPEPGSLPDTLACVDESCDHTLKVKMHCGFPMHIEDGQLSCWMGPSCGTAPLPRHHSKPMKLVFSK